MVSNIKTTPCFEPVAAGIELFVDIWRLFFYSYHQSLQHHYIYICSGVGGFDDNYKITNVKYPQITHF